MRASIRSIQSVVAALILVILASPLLLSQHVRVNGVSSFTTIKLGEDVALTRDAANNLALRNGTNAQCFHIYGTFTNASNYERLALCYDAATDTRFEIKPEAAGTGTARVLALESPSAIRISAASGADVGLQVAGGTVAAFAATPNRAIFTAVLFANIGTPANGAILYCSDCTIANPCAGGGAGAFAKRLNAVWVCN